MSVELWISIVAITIALASLWVSIRTERFAKNVFISKEYPSLDIETKLTSESSKLFLDIWNKTGANAVDISLDSSLFLDDKRHAMDSFNVHIIKAHESERYKLTDKIQKLISDGLLKEVEVKKSLYEEIYLKCSMENYSQIFPILLSLKWAPPLSQCEKQETKYNLEIELNIQKKGKRYFHFWKVLKEIRKIEK